ncbi:MAG: hypothetical protein SOI57_00455 [Leuconostoc gelidum]|jgi:hypothetical protein|uniref:hypothetical protein n=1 Tax=Leuconostoc gelidum TaxID=1244 RepID=UPI0015764A5D|nr:hypothetical protein [Leuconostoc gelidum]MBZ6001285.1 hypothetical protein [Leuconostoc gelidum subsp. gelidum]QDJ29877.1 hypothetical protein BHS02_04150 [Leuconostoc gelidum subsp. gelidum]
MIETQYMNKMLNVDIIVFEVTDGWFLNANGLIQLNIASPQGALSVIDDRFEGFYRGLNWTYDTVQLTPNPLAAMQFEKTNDDFAESVKANFPSGIFKTVSLNATINDVKKVNSQ